MNSFGHEKPLESSASCERVIISMSIKMYTGERPWSTEPRRFSQSDSEDAVLYAFKGTERLASVCIGLLSFIACDTRDLRMSMVEI